MYILFLVFLLVTSVATYYALKSLNFNAEVKSLILKRHFSFVITFAFLNSFILVSFILFER